ncbi:hypothetical protein [Streptomyces sp. NBC_00038]|uniref:hypothetical protein n=1 Tax=Streptomyces sp. NBC_00038 TaxID=2903615 RepID=UPI00225983DC|nr:hypothetical protein [Streptomyces sp. NBC_00038]MCX5562974.1 hypothetical protein [Streptomyces sp. NBC_00038]
MEAEIGAGCLEALVKGAVLGGELAGTLLEGGVLSGDPWDGLLGPLSFHVTDLTEEFADAGALGEDLRVGSLEGGLGVEYAFASVRVAIAVQAGAVDNAERP